MPGAVLRTCLLGIVAIALCACATTYGPMRAGKVGGYTQTPIGSTGYEVRAAANGPADRFAPIIALYRAAELTLQHGYTHFVVTDMQGAQTMVGYGSPTSFAGDDVRLVMEMQNHAEIAPGFVGQAPRLFVARDVMARLQPEIDARQ